MPSPSSSSESRKESNSGITSADIDDSINEIDFRSVCASIFNGRRQILGLAIVGAVAGALIYLAISPLLPVSTSTRIIFAFGGLEKGEYPDHSKFQADDLRSPFVVLKALKQQGLDVGDEAQSKIRGALSIEGVIPPSIVRERDRLRANGQTPPAYIPDEFAVTLTLPRKYPLSSRQRELLVNEIVQDYLQNFQVTYADLPVDFGNAFETLQRADYYEYELILDQEVGRIVTYLSQQIVKSPTFRSPTTHLTFSDLLEQTQLFSQIRLNETLGLIYLKGLSADRGMAIMKMDYYLRNLADEENRALQEEGVVKELLAQAQARSQNYILGVKSQAADPRVQPAVVDQNLIDSLLANDAYSFLVRRALAAGLKVKDVQSQQAKLLERRKNMEVSMKDAAGDETVTKDLVHKSLTDLKANYETLIDNIRKTNSDFALQQFANAIRFGSQIKTDSMAKPLAIYGLVGAAIGFLLGAGMSLLGLHPFPRKIPG